MSRITRTRRRSFPAFLRKPSGAVGSVLTAVALLIALFGGLFAPHPIDASLGAPGHTPGGDYLLGLDYLGRDVLSRTLHGGFSVVVLGSAATLLAYLVALPLGLIAGYNRGKLDSVLMRCLDIILAVPAIIILLLLVSGLGTHAWVLVVGVAVVHLPGVARVMRTAVQEVAVRSFVEAAVARGERLPAILRREILPNVREVLLADVGIRFGWSVLIIASMNFLGVGLQPPIADWGLMISENRGFLSVNPWATAAPAVLFAALVVGLNLLADSYARTAVSVAPDLATATEPSPVA